MSPDFFAQAAPETTVAIADDADAFARALTSRFGPNALATIYAPPPPLAPPSALALTVPPPSAGQLPSAPLPPAPRLALPTPRALPSSPMSPPARTPAAPAPMAFTPTRPADLAALLDDPAALVIDIRPHAAYSIGRLPHALSISVPSTLLKRPLFALDKLADMLPEPTRARFAQWHRASRILVYDADTASAADGTNVKGLLRKFAAAGAPLAKLTWLEGGFQAVWRHARHLVDQDAVSDDEDEVQTGVRPPGPTLAVPGAMLRGRDLPQAAFTLSSTTSKRATSAVPGGEQSHATPRYATQAFNPFFDNIRQNTELSQGITERIPLRLSARIRERVDDLPFEWLKDIAHRAGDDPVANRKNVRAEKQEPTPDGPQPPPRKRSPLEEDVETGAEGLAMQFYRIELAEQRRLTGVMQHHSREGEAEHRDATTSGSSLAARFPYSITAGVEKGAKNRYRNIWPFEHARVRLQKHRSQDDDYVNASYVQPFCTTKRYIATQGPLPATFADFWTLCWEQNVHVIVMLTREVEGSMVKCARYWAEGTYSDVKLRLVSTTGTPEDTDAQPVSYFNIPKTEAEASKPAPAEVPTVRRTFELTHARYPKAPPRTVTQFQYLAWPDMNVPNDPAGLLELVRDVDGVVDADAGEGGAVEKERRRARSPGPWKGSGPDEPDAQTGVARHAMGARPVLLHCSAGVGRSGGFIVVDAVLDGIRREMRKRKGLPVDDESETDDIDMDIDEAGDPQGAQRTAVPLHNGLFAHVPVAEAPLPMDIDVQQQPENGAGMVAGPPGGRHEVEPHQAAHHATPQALASAAASGSGSGAWGRNDPRRAPLRKWLSSTTAAGGPMASTFPKATPGGESADGGSPSPPVRSPVAPSPSTSPDPPPSMPSIAGRAAGGGPLLFSPTWQETPPGAIDPADPRPRVASTSLLRSVQMGMFEARTKKPSPPALPGLADASEATSSFGGGAPSIFSADAPPTQSSRTSPPGGSSRPKASLADGADGARAAAPQILRTLALSAGQMRISLPADARFAAGAPAASLFTSVAAGAGGAGGGGGTGNGGTAPTDTFDYTIPRKLHREGSPPPLSGCDEPVRQVVEDVREQRMSLCQSLRQYVFVHQAIVQGALRLVDEERAGEAAERAIVAAALAVAEKSGAGMSAVSPSPPPVGAGGGGLMPPSPSKAAKRRHSPTELIKKDKTGAVMLSKRPSLNHVLSLSPGAGPSWAGQEKPASG